MKTLFHSIVLLFFSLSYIQAQSKADKLNLSGTVVGQPDGKIYLQRYENKSFTTIDSTNVTNGAFSFNSKVQLPEIYGLSREGSGVNPFDSFIIFLDKNPIVVTFDPSHEFKNTVVKGSREQDLLKELLSNRSQSLEDKLKANPKSIAALYYLYRYQSYKLTPAELRSSIKLLDAGFKKTEYVKVLNELAGTLDGIAVGSKAPNFTAYTKDEVKKELTDYLGQGYVLIDFWASWCPPCRAENPHLRKVYDQYKDKGLEIVGISLDKKVDPWIAAVAQDNLPWQQVYDPKAWAGDAVVKYGVRLIPANFLIDKNGVIIARNLKGEQLDEQLAELLNK